VAIYWNMDRSLLRNGERKAPQITMEQFKELLDAALIGPDSGYSADDFEHRFCDDMEYNYIKGFQTKIGAVYQDLDAIDVGDDESSFAGFAVGANGIPFAKFSIFSDDEEPVRFMIYWDGTEMRAYIPMYGNVLVAANKQAISWCTSFHKGPHVYSENGKLITKTFASEDEFFEFFESCCDLEINEAACAEDFSTCIVNTGKQPDEEVQRALATLKSIVNKRPI